MLFNLIFNIAIPVFILHKFSTSLGPVNALMAALIFPLGFGIVELARSRKFNFISIFGIANIMLTGGLAIFNISGHWFAAKEASVPLLIATFIFLSEWYGQPLIKMFFLNPQIMKTEVLIAKLQERQTENQFNETIKYFNRWFSLSFIFSSCLNLGLSLNIFVPIDPTLAEDAQKNILNEQIATMTQWSWPIIVLPSMCFLAVLLYFFFKKIQQLTGVDMNDLITKD